MSRTLQVDEMSLFSKNTVRTLVNGITGSPRYDWVSQASLEAERDDSPQLVTSGYWHHIS